FVSIVVNRAAVAAVAVVRPVTDCRAVREERIDDVPRNTNAAERAAVRTRIAEPVFAAEGAVHDPNRARRTGAGLDQVIELADRAAADVGTERLAQVVEEAGIHDLEASALRVYRAATAVVVAAVGDPHRAAIDERDVLNHELDAGVRVAVTRSRR